tara:strand:- start:6580 stop:6774 length:195 start_codon:yes stop_codon:yes gene_type:complete
MNKTIKFTDDELFFMLDIMVNQYRDVLRSPFSVKRSYKKKVVKLIDKMNNYFYDEEKNYSIDLS